MNSDSRIINAHSDTKAAVAAVDDARTALHELLDEGPKLGGEDRGDASLAREGLLIAMTGLRLAEPALARIADRFEVTL